MLKKTVLFLMITLFAMLPCFAKNPVNINARVCHEVSVYKDTPSVVEFVLDEPMEVSFLQIPKDSIVKARVMEFYQEKRFHKHAFVICKLISYGNDIEQTNVENLNLYLYLRKHEPVSAKEATITASEFVVTTGASLFAPGVDVGYYFIKGAILREKHPNWFKAGVSNYWDNSIFWLFEKGKKLDLIAGDEIKLIYMPELKARDKCAKVAYKKHKKYFRQEKKLVRSEIKNILRQEKDEEKSIIVKKEVGARLGEAKLPNEMYTAARAAAIKYMIEQDEKVKADSKTLYKASNKKN